MDRSFSLTPPESPVLQQKSRTLLESSSEDTPCFSCKGNNVKNYLKSKAFGKFLGLQLSLESEPITVLFGKPYSTFSVVWTNLPLIFADIKNSYFHVKALSIDNIYCDRTTDTTSVIQSLRKNINESFVFLLTTIQNLHLELSLDSTFSKESIKHCRSSELLIKLMKELKNLLLFVGRISNIPNILHITDFSETSKIAEHYYHYLHMCLDIWWNSTAMLHLISIIPLRLDNNEIFCCDIDYLKPFEQVALLIMSDFICLSINHHGNFNFFSNHSPFICKCIEEIWIMLIIMLNRKTVSKNESFWGLYNKVVQMILKSVNKTQVSSANEIPIHAFSLIGNLLENKDVIESCLWLTSHISMLFKYDKWGHYDELILPESGFVVVKNLIKPIIDESDVKEKKLRYALFHCSKMVMVWEPSCDIILPLTDFFIKRINGTFILQGSDINALSFLHSNSLLWFQHILNLSNASSSIGKETSYDLYLQLLFILLNKSVDGNLWRSLKGRVYSKFMPKKVKEFSEVALQNTFTLFLVIVSVGNQEVINDVAEKIFEITSIIEAGSIPRKQMISWKALFVLMHIYMKKNLNLDKIIFKTRTFFNAVCISYSKIQKDSMHKNNLMNLILVYIDSMSEIFEQCHHLSLCEYKLIDVDFNSLLNSCNSSELNYILNIFLNILMKIQGTINYFDNLDNSSQSQYINFLNLIFSNIYPCIENLFISNTPPLLVSDIAALLMSLTYRFCPLSDISIYEFSDIFINIVCKDGVNCLTICRFLCFVLDDVQIVSGLKDKLDFNNVIFQAYLKCTIYLLPPCTQMQELTPKILIESNVSDLFPMLKTFHFGVSDHVHESITLFRIMGEHYKSCDSLQDKNNLKLKIRQYFRTFVNCVASKIKKQCDATNLTHIYNLTSHLVEYCSQLLHIRFSPDSILPQLLDQTVFPHLIFPKDKSLQLILTNSIKDYLPSFLEGLFKLNYADDRCIEREVKNIIGTYINSYTLSNNPIATIYLESAKEDKQELFDFLLNIMKENILLNNTNHKNGFQVCFEVLKIAPLKLKKEVSLVLLKSALEIYMKQAGPFSDYLRNLVLEVILYFKNKLDVEESKIILIPILEWFIQQKLRWSATRSFNILNNIIDSMPEIFSDIIPFLTKTIIELENMRGLGTDFMLRDHLKSILAKHEKSTIKSEML